MVVHPTYINPYAQTVLGYSPVLMSGAGSVGGQSTFMNTYSNNTQHSIAYNPWSGTGSIPGIQTASLQGIPGQLSGHHQQLTAGTAPQLLSSCQGLTGTNMIASSLQTHPHLSVSCHQLPNTSIQSGSKLITTTAMTKQLTSAGHVTQSKQLTNSCNQLVPVPASSSNSTSSAGGGGRLCSPESTTSPPLIQSDTETVHADSSSSCKNGDSKDNTSSVFPESPCESNASSMLEEINAQYLKELQLEKECMESSDSNLLKGHAVKLLENEILNVQSGNQKNSTCRETVKYFDIYRERPIRLTVRALVPVREHPKFNFVGKLLGPKGNSMKRLQEETLTKMAVLGRGSMRDKQKEEDLRLSQDPKYQHLHEDLHVEVTAFAPPAEAHARIAFALTELRKYLIPDSNDEIRQEQMREMEIITSNGELLENLKQGTQHLLAAGGVGLATGLAAAAATGQPTVPAAATQQLPFQQHQQLLACGSGLPSTGYGVNPYMSTATAQATAALHLQADHNNSINNNDKFCSTSMKSLSSLDTSTLRTQPYNKK